MNHVQLMGAEEVSRAASRMQDAAETIRQQVGYLGDTLSRFHRNMEYLVERLEYLATATAPPAPEATEEK